MGACPYILFLIKVLSMLKDLLRFTCNLLSYIIFNVLHNIVPPKPPLLLTSLFILIVFYFSNKKWSVFQDHKIIFFFSIFTEMHSSIFPPKLYAFHWGIVRTNQWDKCAQWIIRGFKLPKDILTQSELCIKISILLNIC